ncbi:HTH-type transcriptional regulator AcrR [Microbacterium oxydans]|uniref:TetR/AcrR family transcriptional regulator n=1 Tax=Microbacterium oxydans TaxID=82380 RepID=UPI001DC1EA8F|nr:TetR/AcrR family transcriptional regulator [Microbacterium oxydans]CAH0193105.1 HTH-type transcriptional regulator AcrR [Microbacterium oxydans]
MAQYAKTAAVRRGILDACLTIFGESGFHGASMAEIARRAGISHTGLLHHFPRKEDLLMAVLELQDERSAAYLARNDDLAPDADPLDVLRRMATALIERDQRVGLVELSAVLTGEATAPGHPAHDYFAARYRDIRSFVTRLFTRLSDEGRLSPAASPSHLAAVTIAATDGLHTQWLFDRTSIDVDACVTSMMATFVPELRTPAAV